MMSHFAVYVRTRALRRRIDIVSSPLVRNDDLFLSLSPFGARISVIFAKFLRVGRVIMPPALLRVFRRNARRVFRSAQSASENVYLFPRLSRLASCF